MDDGRTGWVLLAAAATVYVAIVCVIVAIRAESSSDFRDFWQTALHLRQTGEITSAKGVHNYLPVFTILMTPWSLAPLRVAVVLFTLLSLAAFVWAVLTVERLLSGPLADRPRAAMLAGVGLLIAYITSSGVVGAVGLLLLFLVVLAWRLFDGGREWPAGAVLGLATLIKLLPAVLIVFFLLKRRWRTAGGALLVIAVGGAAVPAALLGWDQTVRQHLDYYERAIRDHSAYVTIHAERPRKANYSNSALPIVLRRLLSDVNAGKGPDSDAWTVNLVRLPRRAIWWIYTAMMAVFVGTSAWCAIAGSGRWPPDNAAVRRRWRAEYGVWCCLMLIASPLVWTHYFALAYWPLALVADRGQRRHQHHRPCRASRAAMLVWLAGAALLAWPAARAAGAQLAPVIVLWAVTLSMAAETSIADRSQAVPTPQGSSK